MSKVPSISSGSRASSARAQTLPPVAVGLGTLAALLALWQAANAFGLVSPLIAPAPSDIAASFPALISDEGLLQRFIQTFFEALVSAGLAVIVGTPIGWGLHAKRWAGR